VAQVAEVAVSNDGGLEVKRITCAIDCGRAINPDIVRQQMEGGIVFGLSAALHGAVTFAGGRAAQSNFDTYPLLSMAETPEIDVHIVPSTAAPGGVGEPGVPPVAPAVANAVFAATGVRVRDLPFAGKALAG
jgi:isoquinoline 1-oxidoreductase beta subunit